MNEQDRTELRARQDRIAEAEAKVEAALVDRNNWMRELKAKYGRGIIAEMARELGMNRVTVSDLVNPGPGTGRRQHNRGRSRTD